MSQKAALAALTGDQSMVAEMVAAFDERRRLVTRLLGEIPGVRLAPPKGGESGRVRGRPPVSQ